MNTLVETKSDVREHWNGDELMKFRLVLHGSVPSKARGGTVMEKHLLRQQVHQQVKSLWSEHGWLKRGLTPSPRDGKTGLERLADEYARNGFRFAPLVNHFSGLGVGLDIILLRRRNAGGVLTAAGDLDNRVKTLIDALRMPRHGSELGEAVPQAGEDPFFCLLEDDANVYDLFVDAGELLTPVAKGETRDHVHAIIGVTIRFASGLSPAVVMNGQFWPPAPRSKP